jgi:hypothetical protein
MDRVQKNRQNDEKLKSNLNYPTGVIISPFYPGNYSKNHECVVNLKGWFVLFFDI